MNCRVDSSSRNQMHLKTDFPKTPIVIHIVAIIIEHTVSYTHHSDHTKILVATANFMKYQEVSSIYNMILNCSIKQFMHSGPLDLHVSRIIYQRTY